MMGISWGFSAHTRTARYKNTHTQIHTRVYIYLRLYVKV